MRKSIILLVLMFFVFNLSAKNMNGSVVYTVDGQEYEGYYAAARRNSPLIFLVHDWDGLTDYEIKRSDMLAKEGYSVFAVDMFGKDVRPETVEERRELTGNLYADREKMRRLLDGAYEKAKKMKWNVKKAVTIGYCFGGTVALEWARTGTPLKSFITFHGGLSIPEGQDFSMTKGEVVVFHGTADSSVTMDDFAALAKSLESSNVTHEMVTYSGAPHAFTVFGSDRYHKDADEKSWKRFLEYLEEVF